MRNKSKTSRELDDFLEKRKRRRIIEDFIGNLERQDVAICTPSFINTYLPALILEEAPELLEGQNNAQIIDKVKQFSIWSNDRIVEKVGILNQGSNR